MPAPANSLAMWQRNSIIQLFLSILWDGCEKIKQPALR